jgi:hypothetical protein
LEFILFYILDIFLELYTGIIVLYIVIQLLRKKKLPGKILLIESGFLLLFFYLKYLVNQHELIVFGNYKDNPEDYGEGIANMFVYVYNLAFVLGLFLITQLVFWAFFTERFYFMNNQDLKEKQSIDNIKESKK